MAISGDGATVPLTKSQRKLVWDSYVDELWAWEQSAGNVDEFHEFMGLKDWVEVVKWPMEWVPSVAGVG